MKKLRYKIISCILIFMQLLVIFPSDVVFAEPTENKEKVQGIQTAYLDMMRNSGIEDMQDKITSYDDLRCLALFMSNYYIPFLTSLDGVEENEEKSASYKEQMSSSLQILGFNADLADS